MWTALDQRIAPLAQRRNVHVDPVVPPIKRAGVVTEFGALVRGQSGAQPLDIRGLEYMIVIQDERFEQSHQLDHFLEVAFLARERRASRSRTARRSG